MKNRVSPWMTRLRSPRVSVGHSNSVLDGVELHEGGSAKPEKELPQSLHLGLPGRNPRGHVVFAEKVRIGDYALSRLICHTQYFMRLIFKNLVV